MSPNFANDVYQYTADGSDASVEVTAEAVNETATVSAKLNGTDVDLSEPIDIPVGSSTLIINTTEA